MISALYQGRGREGEEGIRMEGRKVEEGMEKRRKGRDRKGSWQV